MKRKTTIVDISKALETTPATVSRALNGNTRISQKMRDRVMEMAKAMGYEIDPVASALRSGKSRTLGVIVPYIDRSFFSSVIRGIEEELKTKGYNMMICQSSENPESEAESVEILLNARVAGIAMSLAGMEEEHLQKIVDRDIPLVTFDRISENISPYSVAADDFEGSFLVTNHMIHQGYQRIAYLAGDQRINIYRNRLRGYRAALEENGIQPDPQLIIDTPSDRKAGWKAAAYLMKSNNVPDAIGSSSDFSALGALQYCKSQGLSIPEDIGIAGFANEEFTEFLDPALTSVNQKSLEMGRIVGKSFFESMNQDSGNPKKILLKPELIVRQSTLRNK